MNISEAESIVMQVLWQQGAPLSGDEIALALAGQQDWQTATVKTLLNRLLGKGAISAQKDGRRFLYSPILAREAWLSEQSMGLLDRLFGGSLTPLVAHFASHRKLKAADLKALKKLIDEQERK